jgi:Ig-like domain from next to BRCA1 gene
LEGFAVSVSRKTIWGVLMIASLMLASCGGGEQAPTPTVPDPAVVLTAAASTAAARMSAQATSQPSPLPAATTPSPAAGTEAITATLQVSPTVNLPPAPSPVAGGTDKAEFVSDVTVPDGSVFSPGESFTKTWRLKNTGTATWTPTYTLVFMSGNQMGDSASVPLPKNVPPNETVDVSVNMKAPDQAGNYFGFWILRNASQKNFGVGPNSDQPVYVEINVQAGGGQGTPSATLPPGTSGNSVKDVSIAVDTPYFEGTCPHTFNFIAKFTLTRPATVTYGLEAETGFPLDLPAPITGGLQAGTYTLSYALEFSDVVNGWARLHVTAPEDVASNQATFTLKCQ